MFHLEEKQYMVEHCFQVFIGHVVLVPLKFIWQSLLELTETQYIFLPPFSWLEVLVGVYGETRWIAFCLVSKKMQEK